MFHMVVSIFLTLIAVGIPVWFSTRTSLSLGSWAGVAGMCFCLCALSICILVSAHQRRIEILADRIRIVGALNHFKERRFEDLEGFRILETDYRPMLVLVPKGKATKKLRIELVYQRREEFLKQLQAAVRNLDAEDLQTELKEVLANQHLGGSEEQRMETLKTVRKCVGALNYATTVAVLWGLIYPQPYACAMTVLALLPLLAAAMVQWFPHAVKFDGNKDSARPMVASLFFGPACVLAFRAFRDWNVLEWANVWMPMISIAAAMTIWMALCAADVRKKRGALISVVLFGLVYGYGLVVYLNCYYDHSQPVVHRTVVRSRDISHGQYVSYNLKLKPWLGRDEEREVEVSQSVYEQHEVGSHATILVGQGALSIKWFCIR